MQIEEQVVQKLIDKEYHISFAESCTGGLAAATLVSVADASKVFNAGFITYANEAKEEYLGVKEETIETFGVVSEEVAREMAVGTAMATDSEVGVGITGIAGPGGGTDKKPVGMVCFGFYIAGKIYTETKQFGCIGRNEVRNASAEYVYARLKELIS